jgi:hypothetical protein
VSEPCSAASHQWSLGIEEGGLGLTTASCGPECRWLMAGDVHPAFGTLGDEIEWLHMEPVQGDVRFATECPAYETDENQVPTGPPRPMPGYEVGSHYIAHGTRCDCNWWPVVLMTDARERDAEKVER